MVITPVSGSLKIVITKTAAQIIVLLDAWLTSLTVATIYGFSVTKSGDQLVFTLIYD